jgi:hypothetical protein
MIQAIKTLAISSVDSYSRLSFAFVALALLMARPISSDNAVHEKTLSCPATIDVGETATAVSGWQASNRVVKRKFERVSIYNGKNGGQEFDLAPDNEKQEHGRITQIWRLSGYRSMNIFLRCRYSGTEAVLSRDIPAGFETCTFVFSLDKSGNITATSSFACR